MQESLPGLGSLNFNSWINPNCPFLTVKNAVAHIYLQERIGRELLYQAGHSQAQGLLDLRQVWVRLGRSFVEHPLDVNVTYASQCSVSKPAPTAPLEIRAPTKSEAYRKTTQRL